MSKQTRNSNSRSTAATVVKATGVQEDGVGTTSTTSDPSGLRAPDGANTPQSSGDAAGKASVDLVKPQADSDPTKTTMVEAENQAPAPVVEAAASGDLPKDDETVYGTGANAGSVQPTFDLDGVLIATGTASFEDLLHAASLGKRTVSIVEEIVVLFPELDRETPAEIVEALLKEATALRVEVDRIASARGSAGTSSEESDDTPELGENYPLTHALLKDWDETRAPIIRITSKVAGFRRGGIAHPAQAVDHPIRSMSPDQLEKFLGEPNLTVELV